MDRLNYRVIWREFIHGYFPTSAITATVRPIDR
jgi:hypothetical protein